MSLANYLGNLTEGVTAFSGWIGSVGESFMQPPFVIIPIVGVGFLSYKVGMMILRKVKNAA